MVSVRRLNLIAKKVKRRDGRTYYNLADDSMVGGNVDQNYVG